MKTNLIQNISDSHQAYLTDESKQEGSAESISFPVTEDEVAEIMKTLPEEPMTFQGANTGVEGLAVPHGGHAMNFSKMNRILEIGMDAGGEGYAVAEPGAALQDLNREIDSKLRKERLFWPPQPTESSASIGGIAATGAYGMNSYHYGETRKYISAVSFVSREGERISLSRETEEASRKLDAFLLSEQKPGAITKLTLRLARKPESVWGIAFFFDDTEQSLQCADALQKCRVQEEGAWIQSMEYLDHTAVSMVEQGKDVIAKIRSIPPVPEGTRAMILLEIAGEEDAIESVLMEVMELTESFGSDSDKAWALTGEAETEKLRDYRHAAAETVIQWIERYHRMDRRITKLGAKPPHKGRAFSEMVRSLYEDLEEQGLRASIYAHIKNSDIQVNILPENFEEFTKGEALIGRWMQASQKESGERT